MSLPYGFTQTVIYIGHPRDLRTALVAGLVCKNLHLSLPCLIRPRVTREAGRVHEDAIHDGIKEARGRRPALRAPDFDEQPATPAWALRRG
jgi:hypothetical protein